MKITQHELVEFVDEQKLEILGKSELITSKMKALQRLIQRGLLPKPKWEGGNLNSYWENGAEIKDRLLWLEGQKKKGKSYRQMREALKPKEKTRPEEAFAKNLIWVLDILLELNPDNIELSFLKSNTLYKIGERNKALEILEKIVKKRNLNNKFLILVYKGIAGIYHSFVNKEKELEACNKMISLAKEIGDSSTLGEAYLDMGNCFRSREGLDMALKYYKLSLDLLEGTTSIADAYANIYWIYKERKDYAEAEKSLKKSINIYEESSNNKYKESVCKANLGSVYLKMNKLTQALKYMKEAYNVITQLHDLDGESAIMGNMGKVYLKQGKFNKAIEHFRHAYHIAIQINNPEEQRIWLSFMSEVYKKMGDSNKSKFYMKESKKIEETIQKIG